MGAEKHRSDAIEPQVDDSSESEDNGPKPSGASSLKRKPMEQKKKRKSMDKDRRRQSDLKSDALSKKPKLEAPPTATPQVPVAAGGGAMPELHLGLFGDLASVESSVREAAVEALGRELREVQSAYEWIGEKKGNELVANVAPMEAEEKNDGLENCAPSMRYALRRLIRGVSSSRECARQGFATALTVVLATIPAIRVSSVMKLIVQSLEVSSSRKGQEARDGLLGRLFAFGALARSGRMTPESLLDKNTSCLEEFLGLVTYLAGKKQYLLEPAVLVILELIDKLPTEGVRSYVLESESMNKWFEKAASEKQPDALLLVLKLQERVPLKDGIFGGLLPQPFAINNFFSREHLSLLVPCFQASTFCQPRVHSLWSVIINILVPSVASQDETIMFSSSSKKHKKAKKGSSSEDLTKNIRNFTKVVIEGSLLTSSHDRKHLAFNIILMLLPRLPAHSIHTVLSYKLIQCLMDVLSTKGTWLYNAAQHFLKGLVNWVGKDTERMIAIIVALQKHSGGRFDCITRTNTVEEFIATFKTGPACRQFVQSLIELFVDEQGLPNELSDQSQNADKNFEKDMIESSSLMTGSSDLLKDWVINTLPRVLKNLKLCPEMKFSHEDVAAFQEEKYHLQTEVMKFLTVQGLFSASLGNEVTSFELQETLKWPKTATSISLCRKCIEKLQFVMEDAQKGDDPRTSSANPEKNDLVSCFVRMLRTLCNIPSISLFRTLNSEDEKAVKKLQEVETRLSHEERKTEAGAAATSKLRALRYLLIQLLLQVLLQPGEFSEAASELVICCRKAFPGSFEGDVLEKEEEFDGEDNGMPDMMDVLVDTLLYLLPQASARMCFAIEQVFRFFCNEITDTGLLRMLRIIKKDLKPLRHQTDESDEDDEDDEDFLEVEDAEDASDVEAIDSADANTTHMKETEQPEESDEDEEEMDDEAMFRMDSYITQFLKKSGGDSATSQLMLFKLRILSLLEIYLQRNPGKHQVFTIFSHLVRAYVNYHSAEGCKQLGERIWGILQKKIFKAKEYPRDNETEFSSLVKLLDKSLKSGSRARFKSVTLLANNSAFWILKIIHSRNLAESQVEDVVRMFQDLLVDYFTCKKSRLKPGFIKEVIQRHPWIWHRLFGFLLENGANAKSEFRRVEALDFVDSVMKLCVSVKKGECEKDVSRKSKFLKKHLPQLCEMMGQMLSNLPKKQSRRATVRKFCARIFNAVSILKLNKPFLKSLTPDACSACESQLGNLFTVLKAPTEA